MCPHADNSEVCLDSRADTRVRPYIVKQAGNILIIKEIFMIEQELERLLAAARADAQLKSELIKTRDSENPVEDFCALCREKGYQITAGELFAAGQTQNDAKLRSVNGGGVNPIDGWDDMYEQFFTELIWCK